MAWLELAELLSMSLTEVKEKTSSSEFVLWQEYMTWKVNSFDRLIWQLAALIAEVRRSYVSKEHAAKIRIEDCIVKFKTEPDKPMSQEERTMRAKQFFFALTGLTGKGKNAGS